MRKLLFCCAVAVAVLTAIPAPEAPAKPRARTLAGELAKLERRGKIDRATYEAHRATLTAARRHLKGLFGTRRAELAGALAVAEGIAQRGALRASRLAPVFLTVQRNAEWWRDQPLLASGQRISFPGSELVWQQVPGQGIHLHPLANFGKLNAYARGSRRNDPRTEVLLDELLSIAVPRGGGLAWEYYFTFGGGRGPWVSGLAQGTGLQAVARAGVRLDRLEEVRPVIEQGLELFEQAPPTGVRVETDAGAHYAQYSYAPDLRIANGFVQSLVGLFDVAEITGDERAARLFAEGDAQGRREIPAYDTGAWSLYSRGSITRESDLAYHTLLRDFLANLCDRTLTLAYCNAADRHTAYLTTPPELRLVSDELRGGRPGRLRFRLSKVSRVTVVVTDARGRTALTAALGTVARGTPAVAWEPPRAGGRFTWRVDAVDLAGNRGTAEGSLRVLKGRRRG